MSWPRHATSTPIKQGVFVAAILGVSLNALVLWLLNAYLPPGINESHYLPKAKHAWDPTFAPGDLFLQSGNAHWLFVQIAGWMSSLMPLPAVAWVGRLVSWLAMGWAWHRLASKLRLPGLMAAAFVLAAWVVATRLGNWAGEWAIGGFEAKALAYPLVVLALAELVAGQWPRVWWLMGGAIALHPLAGGWAALTAAGAWLWFGRKDSGWRQQILPAIVGCAISLPGLLPALNALGGPTRSGEVVVAQIHAFYRLAHHQSPRLFDASQHAAGIVSLSLLAGATLLVFGTGYANRSEPPAETTPGADIPVRALLRVAWLSVAVSGCGLIIDVLGVRWRPDLAASLLRFYWFRWSDVMVPMAWVSGLWVFSIRLWSAAAIEGQSARASTYSGRLVHALGVLPLTLLVLITLASIADQVLRQWRSEIAPADRTLLMSDSLQFASGTEVVRDWQAACAWISENTASDALFLTPRAQQTFKWYAGRAEVVTFKDVPQDSRSLLEWYDRVGRCAPPRNAAGEPLGWTTAQLKRLQARYHFQYVVVDRRIQREPPLLEMVYPTGLAYNSTYAIFKFASSGTH